jgi:RNA polymerase sigma-70 factor (ECF subfamily)
MSQTTSTIKKNAAITPFKSHAEELQMICAAMKNQGTDEQAWNTFYDQYNRFVFAIANKYMCNEDDAEDITQEIFVKCIEEFAKYNQEKPFKPWLSQVIKNHCLNALKQKASKKTHYVGAITLEDFNHQSEEDILYFNAIDAKAKSPVDEAMQKELQKSIETLISKMKPDFIEVIKMKYYEGMSYEQMAKAINVPTGTVMSRLYNAKKKLKELYDQALAVE